MDEPGQELERRAETTQDDNESANMPYFKYLTRVRSERPESGDDLVRIICDQVVNVRTSIAREVAKAGYFIGGCIFLAGGLLAFVPGEFEFVAAGWMFGAGCMCGLLWIFR